MSEELRPAVEVFRNAVDATGAFIRFKHKSEQAAAAVIRDYGDRRDADAYQRGKLEGARLALEAAAKSARGYSAKAKLRCWATRPDSASVAGQHIAANIRALDPAKIVGQG